MTAATKGSARRAATFITLAIMIAVMAAVALGAFAAFGAKPGQGPEFTNADLVRVERMDFDVTTTATGELAAGSQVEVRSQLDWETTIVEVIEEGVTVKKGDLLVRLNADRIETEIEEEELRLESAKATMVAAENAYLIQVSRNESALRDAKLDVELKRLALEQWLKGDDKSERQSIRKRIDSAERRLATARREFAKDKELHARNFLSDFKLDQSEENVFDLEAENETAQLQHEIYENYIRPAQQKTKESDVVQAEAKLKEVIAQNEIELVSKDASRVNERSQLQRREARMERLKNDLDSTEIRAPTDGLVVYGTSVQRDRWGNNNEGPLQIGRRVYENMLLIILPDTSEMIASVRVHESLVGRIKIGHNAKLKIDAAGGEVFTGKVTEIGVLAEGGGWRDPNRREYTVRIKLDLNGEATKLKPSMRCEATIIMDHVTDELGIPLPALFSEGGLRYVYVRDGGKFVKRPVKINRKSDTYVEVVAGIKEGDLVLVREPAPTEVVQRDWNEDELKVAGFKLDENGEPVSTDRRAQRGPGGMPNRGAPPVDGQPMGAGDDQRRGERPEGRPGGQRPDRNDAQ